jgi:hypothetical protein
MGLTTAYKEEEFSCETFDPHIQDYREVSDCQHEAEFQYPVMSIMTPTLRNKLLLYFLKKDENESILCPLDEIYAYIRPKHIRKFVEEAKLYTKDEIKILRKLISDEFYFIDIIDGYLQAMKKKHLSIIENEKLLIEYQKGYDLFYGEE